MLVGIGNMGHALLHYRFHERNKMKIIMAFDLDDHPEVGTQTPDGIPIYGISQIKDKIKDADVKTAILTVPSVKSQEVANLLVDAGVKGILSFSPVHLHLPICLTPFTLFKEKPEAGLAANAEEAANATLNTATVFTSF